ncbi:sugar porter family MFS transporter [Maribacter algarum]|uniref:Sugar porter family MFS transporter n=1 Tax=Maribacter algarum (ex Zhang et al. 2020) TaxID=2578118 RepID=A0A5S3PH31_9FLAO|nr:MFS transporter [Maribacter algarum]TMM53417.1 sugar porter family MFS transporter [Maribacter algarum]
MANYKKNSYTYATIVAMGGFVFGIDAALISGTTNYLTEEFSLNELQLGAAVGAAAWGVLLALLFVGYAVNKIGRKRALQISAAVYLISAIGSAFAPNYWTFISARFLGGLAFSSISMASMYIGEIAPPKWRGKLVSMIQINIVVGLSAAYFINYMIQNWANSGAEWVSTLGIDTNTWRWMLGSEIIFALLWFVLLIIIPRSPVWLVLKEKIGEAKDTLRKVIPENEVTNQITEMQESLQTTGGEQSDWEQFKEIFSKPMRITFIIAATLAIAQQATGINAILFYAPTVFEQLGMGTDAAFSQAIWIGVISVIFTVLGLLVVDKIGRRPMILGGMLWIIISLGICFYGFNSATYSLSKENVSELTELPNSERLDVLVDKSYESDIEFKEALSETLGGDDAKKYSSALIQKAANINGLLILIGILSFIAAFQSTIGPVMWVLFSEIFPISNRGIAIPVFVFLTSITSSFVQTFFPWQLENLGIGATLLFYASTVAIGLIILFIYLKETKNLTIEEVQLALAPKKK